MKKEEQIKFWSLYSVIASTDNFSSSVPVIKSCRFCGYSQDRVPFKKVAHVCPELLGRNDFIGFEECDNCNEKFSAYESHLSKYFLPYLAMLGVRGKKKVPEFHSRTEGNDLATRTIVRLGDDGKRMLEIGEREDYKIDPLNKTASIRFRLPPHRPLYVYMALVKIGLTLLPANYLDKYKSVFDWLDGTKSAEIGLLPRVIMTRLTSKQFKHPRVDLYETKEIFHQGGFRPELVMIVNFGNLILQVPMPLSKEFPLDSLRNHTATLDVYPGFIFNHDHELDKGKKPEEVVTIQVNYTELDLRETETVTRDETMHFTFDKLERMVDGKFLDLNSR